MKSRKSKLIVLSVLIAGVVAWSPPNSEDLVVGAGNTVNSPSGYLGVIGDSNTAKGRGVLIVGESNTIPNIGTRSSVIIGRDNLFNNGREAGLTVGINNTTNATSSLVTGSANTMEGSAVGAQAWHSAAIGEANHLMTDLGWAVGSGNEITGSKGVTIGSNNIASGLQSAAFGSYNFVTASYSYALGAGLRVHQSSAVALGRWNAPMVAGDVLAVGIGDSTTPATGFRVTSDGSIYLGGATSGKVVLARPQGDISMGAYAN